MLRFAQRMSARAEQLATWSTFDWSPDHLPPPRRRIALATTAALAGSILADGVLVATAERLFPSLRSFAHFSPLVWVALTVVGVLGACAAWPVVAAVTRRPQWLFCWMAFAVTLTLWLPDTILLAQRQPGRAVAVLMLMHLAIAVVTFESLVRIAPVRAHQRPWIDDTVAALVSEIPLWAATAEPAGAAEPVGAEAVGGAPAWSAGTLGPAAGTGPGGAVEDDLAQPHGVRGHLDALVVADEFEGLLQ